MALTALFDVYAVVDRDYGPGSSPTSSRPFWLRGKHIGVIAQVDNTSFEVRCTNTNAAYYEGEQNWFVSTINPAWSEVQTATVFFSRARDDGVLATSLEVRDALSRLLL